MTRYYLIDGTYAHQKISELKPSNQSDVVWLYGHNDSEKSQASPILLKDGTALASKITELATEETAYQWIQRFDSPFTLVQLSNHFAHYNQFRTDDDLGYYLRYADPRVISYLHLIFTQEQWTCLTSPTQNWAYINRALEWQMIQYPESKGEPQLSFEPKLVFTQQQMNKLMELYAPDMLLNDAIGADEALEGIAKPNELYQWVKSSYELSQKWASYDEQLLMSLIALGSKGEVFNHPEWLQKINKDKTNREHELRKALQQIEIKRFEL